VFMESKVRVNITLSRGLIDLAHDRGINVSRVAENAVVRSLQALEKETGVAPSKATSPATAPMSGRASDCQLQKC
jgi:post-segregation antitoxin (ccd killing protein)